ncbi:GNAT family N-acetyltransferase [Paracoccus suum]|uniref:GNAT family N-acetyltransferase n=2 Tax=Paracoccus suum TaxID=2259340 RepID=A0A344PP71_9RHOB|nr:GNAT family N-acetyltransferase [Paracoccus suum]AXC51176.1 GNAT family N-acetyltransferase [Paracoccus suum]
MDDELGRTRETGSLDHYRAAFNAMKAEGNNQLIVGTDANGAVIACYQLTLIWGLSLSAACRAQIEGVRVAANLRGAGIGAALLTDAEDRARAGGARLMQLTSNAARTDARRFYERAGYASTHIGFKKPLVP